MKKKRKWPPATWWSCCNYSWRTLELWGYFIRTIGSRFVFKLARQKAKASPLECYSRRFTYRRFPLRRNGWIFRLFFFSLSYYFFPLLSRSFFSFSLSLVLLLLHFFFSFLTIVVVVIVVYEERKRWSVKPTRGPSSLAAGQGQREWKKERKILYRFFLCVCCCMCMCVLLLLCFVALSFFFPLLSPLLRAPGFFVIIRPFLQSFSLRRDKWRENEAALLLQIFVFFSIGFIPQKEKKNRKENKIDK